MLIYDLTFDRLTEILKENNISAFRADQIWQWLYRKKVTTFEQMTNLPETLIKFLSEKFNFKALTLKVKNESSDGTIKFLYDLVDNNLIETVLMSHHYGKSICVTTQVGCNMGCRFCASGIIKKKRNLSAGEIVAQIIQVELSANTRVDSVVVMGIGEPFDNYSNLVDFLQIVNHPKGLAIGARHITVSTSGIVPKIKEFAKIGLQVNLAISLHAPNDQLRSELMPINQRYNLNELITAIKYYINETNRRVTIEYILINEFNDSLKQANELAKLLSGMNVYVNLIPYNPVKEVKYQRSTKTRQLSFYDTLKKEKIQVTLRREQGTDINAACGQLRSANL